MFKQTRRKIVLSIIGILGVLFLGTLGVIYGSSYYEVSQRNREMLQRYVELYSLESQPGKDMPGNEMPEKDLPEKKISEPEDALLFEKAHTFDLSTFYSVALSGNGTVLAIDNNGAVMYEDEILADIAKEIAEEEKTSGTKKNLLYMLEEKEDYTLVAFMDNTVMQESMTTLFRYTLVFGSIVLVLLFFVAVYLARKIVRPVEETYGKQKQFISDAGHELKTPVSAISANAEMLSREIGENQWLFNIRYENERMGELVTQLLELARTENMALPMENVDFSRLAEGEALPFECVAFEKGIKIVYEIEKDVFVIGNETQLKQLVAILFDNAVSHCSGKKEITLSLKRERKDALLSVANSGVEIPKEQRELIFERFYRGDTSRSGEEGHYGLGLPIARAIVQGHKGRIDVLCHDEKVEFVVRIPLQKRGK